MATPRTYVLLKQAISVALQDSTVSGQATSNAKYPSAELDEYIADALREISQYSPFLMKESFNMEGRRGTATSTTANALVDATNAQFVSTDVGKVIFNDNDKTWAVVTAYSSASQLTLSSDIMASGESYYMYNQDCYNSRQIRIADTTDDMSIAAVEFPVNHRPPYYRNWIVLEQGNVLELDIAFEPEDTRATNTSAEKEVYVYFKKRHRVSQLTDFAAAIDNGAGYSAGDTTIHIDALENGTPVIEEDTLLTISGVRGTYRVTTDATVGSNEVDIIITPGLADAVADDVVVTIVQSSLNTLTPGLERLLIDLVAARALIKKSRKYTAAIGISGQNTWQDMLTQGRDEEARVIRELKSMARGKNVYERFSTGY